MCFPNVFSQFQFYSSKCRCTDDQSVSVGNLRECFETSFVRPRIIQPHTRKGFAGPTNAVEAQGSVLLNNNNAITEIPRCV